MACKATALRACIAGTGGTATRAPSLMPALDCPLPAPQTVLAGTGALSQQMAAVDALPYRQAAVAHLGLVEAPQPQPVITILNKQVCRVWLGSLAACTRLGLRSSACQAASWRPALATRPQLHAPPHPPAHHPLANPGRRGGAWWRTQTRWRRRWRDATLPPTCKWLTLGRSQT